MLAIVDGDVLAYQACRNKGETRFFLSEGDPDGLLSQQEMTKEERTKLLIKFWDNFKRDLRELVEGNFCTDYVLALKGEDNYRNRLYPDYKLNRHAEGIKQNPFVKHLRDLAVLEENGVYSHGCEADDLMRIWAEEARRADKDYVICSIDKDLRCIPGKHYIMHYDPLKRGLIEVSEQEARLNYYSQILKGDPTDNIPGVPRVGEVKAKKYLEGCTTEEEMQEVVVSEYILAYGDEWFNYFLINAKLIHLQTHRDDYFNCENWPIIRALVMD